MLVLWLALITTTGGQASVPVQPPQQDPASHASLTHNQISQIQTKAESGVASAQEALGKAYEEGNGVPRDDVSAVRWYRKAADQGNAAAEDDLGVMYRLGQGVEKNKEEAVRWYRKAAKHGNPQAMFNLGASYYNGDGVNSDLNLADVWFLLAKDAGSEPAKDAVTRTATELGVKSDYRAMLVIASMYEKGDELSKSDSAAVQWYRRAAEGDPGGKVRLAVMLVDGKGTARDYTQALDFCKSAAQDRYAPGPFCVGYLYEHGLGMPADLKEAAKWYGEASALGHTQATLRLAEMNVKGDGIPIDRAEAYFLYFSAYRQGSDDAKTQARALFKNLSKEETKSLEKKLRTRHLDPKSVFAAVESDAPVDRSRVRLGPALGR